MAGKKTPSSLTLRPYELLCIFCSIGQEASYPKNIKFHRILTTIKDNPEIPITVRCNIGDVYWYQDPGTKDDTPEGAEYNIKRDLEILHRLDLAPGSTLPARTLFIRLLKRVSNVSGICGYDTVTSGAWKGCPNAKKGYYEKGHAKGLAAIIPPRSKEEMEMEKEKSLKSLYSANEVRIRPHILMCAVCQYGNGKRPPFKADNLPEFIEMVLNKKPDIPVTLVRGADWMMCAPCSARVPKLNACVCNTNGSGGLYNEMKDLNVLQKLGLTYGTTMKAKELFKLLFERIPTIVGACALNNNDKPSYSLWWDPCGSVPSKPHTGYEKGREELMEKFK